MPKGSPLRVFLYFATECILIYPEGSPFYIFRHYATILKEKNFNFQKFQVFFQKTFNAFLASDMAPTLDVLVLFMVHLVQCEDVTHVYHTFNLFSHRSKKAPTDRQARTWAYLDYT